MTSGLLPYKKSYICRQRYRQVVSVRDQSPIYAELHLSHTWSMRPAPQSKEVMLAAEGHNQPLRQNPLVALGQREEDP